ncbi:MAG TPA: TetR family transcriptional regulator [Pseudidiomarina sp.]|nr:TetR family transcriptional regulator [Pseudidiomarina sp.]
MVRRTKEDALSTRNDLLDAAERLFSERGVATTSMMQVAEAAGVTRGAIYHHFENKLDLIESLMDRVKLPVDEMFEELAKSIPDDPLGQLKHRCLKIVKQVQDDQHTQALINILFHKCEYIDDVLPIHQRHLHGRNACIDECEKLIEHAIEKGQVSQNVKPRETVIGMFSLIDGLMYNWLLDRDYFNLEQVAKTSLDRYCASLAD